MMARRRKTETEVVVNGVVIPETDEDRRRKATRAVLVDEDAKASEDMSPAAALTRNPDPRAWRHLVGEEVVEYMDVFCVVDERTNELLSGPWLIEAPARCAMEHHGMPLLVSSCGDGSCRECQCHAGLVYCRTCRLFGCPEHRCSDH